MANTWGKAALDIVVPDSEFLALITREAPEGASQTFPAFSPTKIASGLHAVFVNPTDGLLAAFAVIAGQNTTGANTKIVRAVQGVEIEANFLGAAAADNVLAAADYGGKFDLLSSSTLIGGASAGWYISDATADPSVRISAFKTSHPLPNVVATDPAVGDTNARVRAIPILTKTHWYDV